MLLLFTWSVSTNNIATINTSIVLLYVVCATSVHLDCVSTNNTSNTSIVLVVVVCATSVHLDCVSTNNTINTSIVLVDVVCATCVSTNDILFY